MTQIIIVSLPLSISLSQFLVKEKKQSLRINEIRLLNSVDFRKKRIFYFSDFKNI
jgi:hypothetical protein